MKNFKECDISNPTVRITLNSAWKGDNDSHWISLTVNWKHIHEVADGDWIGVWSTNIIEDFSDPMREIKVINPDGKMSLKIKTEKDFSYQGSLKEFMTNYTQCFKYWVAFVRLSKILYYSCLKLRPHWMQEITEDIKLLKLSEIILPGMSYSHTSSNVKLWPSPWNELIFGARYLRTEIFYERATNTFYTIIDKKVPFLNYLYDIYSFMELSKEIVVLDLVLESPKDEALIILEDVLITVLHDYLVPSKLEPSPTLETLWHLDQRLIVACDYLDKSEFIWRSVNRVVYANNELLYTWAQIHLYGQNSLWVSAISDFDQNEESLTEFLYSFEKSLWKSFNILTISCIPCTNLIELAIEGNMKKQYCPEHQQTMRLLRKLNWRENQNMLTSQQVCSDNGDSKVRVWPTLKALPHFVLGNMAYRVIRINWEANETIPGDLVAVFQESPEENYELQDRDVPPPWARLQTARDREEGPVEVKSNGTSNNKKPLFITRVHVRKGSAASTVPYGRPSVSELSKGGCVGPWVAFIRNRKVLASRCIDTHPTWMWTNRAALAHHPMRSLVIPGTHNSGSYSTNDHYDPITAWVVCQDETIISQLLYGIRYLDLRVGYYPETKELLWINHDRFQWQPLQPILEDIRAFADMSPDPVIVDIHRTPVGFDGSEEAPRLLLSILNTTFGKYLAPYSFGYNVTLGDLWESGQTLLVSYGGPRLRDEVPWLWPPIFHAWANAQELDVLENYLDQRMKTEAKYGTMWAAMGHLSPTFWDIIFKVDLGVRGMAEKTGSPLTEWLRNKWAKNVNIITSDFFHANDVLFQSIRLNAMKSECPQSIPVASSLYSDLSTRLLTFV